MLEKLRQAIKQAPRYESSNQGVIFAIKIFDRRRRWKYGAYSGDYPLNMVIFQKLIVIDHHLLLH